jgi:hypothetical protein
VFFKPKGVQTDIGAFAANPGSVHANAYSVFGSNGNTIAQHNILISDNYSGNSLEISAGVIEGTAVVEA